MWPSSNANAPASTATSPGRRSTPRSGARSRAGSPATSGTDAMTQPAAAIDSTATAAKIVRQPSRLADRVPSGTPNASASGIPAMEIASARPLTCSSTRRIA